MKIVYTGLESSGKTLIVAQKIQDILYRNMKWRKKYGFIRPIYSNIQFSDKFKILGKDFLHFFKDRREIIGKIGCDIFWDEISSDFSALKKEPLPIGVNRWLRQGAKQGVHIYATAQEFHDIHLDFRRRVLYCYNTRKFIGSERPGLNLPKIKIIWGFIFKSEIDIHPYNELEPKKLNWFPSILWIGKNLCNIFNTNQVVEGSEETPLEHIVKKCERNDCNFKKIIHR